MNSENMFEYLEEESEQELPLSQKLYSVENVQPSEGTNEVLDLLKKMQEQMYQLTGKLNKMEECIKSLMETQVVLNNNQVAIVGNQQAIATKLETMEENMVIKPEMLAQAKNLFEAKISIKKIEGSVSRITGEKPVEVMDAVAASFPLKSTAEVEELEKKLEDEEFAQAMTTYLYRIKGVSEDVGTITRSIFKDSLMEGYNLDGRCEKRALIKLKLFDKFLRDVFQNSGFDKSLRKAVDKSHNRSKQLRYLKKPK